MIYPLSKHDVKSLDLGGILDIRLLIICIKFICNYGSYQLKIKYNKNIEQFKAVVSGRAETGIYENTRKFDAAVIA